jgi:hypothetical protein
VAGGGGRIDEAEAEAEAEAERIFIGGRAGAAGGQGRGRGVGSWRLTDARWTDGYPYFWGFIKSLRDWVFENIGLIELYWNEILKYGGYMIQNFVT